MFNNCWAATERQLMLPILPVPSFGMLLFPSPTVPDVEAIATCMIADGLVCSVVEQPDQMGIAAREEGEDISWEVCEGDEERDRGRESGRE